jgi:hypothetical protein
MKLAGVAVVALLAVALPAPVADGGTPEPNTDITIARGPGPRSGTFRITGTHRDSATCLSLTRRLRIHGTVREFFVRGCSAAVPKRRQLRGYATYICGADEMLVVGGVARNAARVEVELWDGKRLEAQIFTPPSTLRYRARVFALLTREKSLTGAFVDDIHPRSIRAYAADGSVLASQGFRAGRGSAYDCF